MTTSVLHDIVASATNIAETTRARYLHDLDAWIAFAGKDPVNWNRKKAQAFYADLLKRMKSQSANRLMASVAFAAKWWSVQEDDLNKNFVVVQKKKNSASDPKQALTQDQARDMLNGCRFVQNDPVDLRDFALLVVALETGMRRMSLQSMQWQHCYFNGDAKAGYPTARVLMKGSGTDRVAVPLSDTAILVLQRWGSWLAANGGLTTPGPVFQALSRHLKGDHFRHQASGEPISDTALHKIVVGRSEAVGLTDISPHAFRHTFVTWRMQAGFPAHAIAAMTGHTIRELGAMAGYVDPIQVGETIRNSTPPWLALLVKEKLG